MMALKIALMFALCIVLTNGCEMNDELVSRTAMKCATKNPSFFAEVAEHFASKTKIDMKFVCRYKQVIVTTLRCFLNNIEECVPEQLKSLFSLVPSDDHMINGLDFMCNHTSVLNSNCMDDHLQSFMECYRDRIREMVEGGTEAIVANPLGAVCKIVRYEEKCIMENRASCTDEFLKILFTTLEKFFPMSQCPKSAAMSALEKFNTPLGAILRRGQPQGNARGRYQPIVIKN